MTSSKFWIVISGIVTLCVGGYFYLHSESHFDMPALGKSPDAASNNVATEELAVLHSPGRSPTTVDSPSAAPLLSSSISGMSPDKAYADAYSILRCSHAANSKLSIPDDLSPAEEKQFQQSRIAGLDCSALESKHSAYELAKYAAEKGNIQAQLDFPAIAASLFNEEENALNPELIAQYKADSIKYLNMAAASGNPDAYARLADNYKVGLFANKDKILAYANAYASNQIRPTDASNIWLSNFERDLSSAELLHAKKMGQELISRK